MNAVSASAMSIDCRKAEFHAATFDTGFIDRILPEIDFAHRPADERHVDAAIAAAAILAFEESQKVQLPADTASGWRHAVRTEAVRGRL